MSWSDERVDLLKKLWSEGQSASQIAKELGGVTRNAVIGKVHRLGLSNRNGSAPAAGATPVDEAEVETESQVEAEAAAPASGISTDPAPKPAAPAEPDDEEAVTVEAQVRIKAIIPAGQPLPPQPSVNEIDPEALAKVSEIEKKAKRLTLMELTERTCKWPLGDPATDDFWFCGLPVQPGKPYCEAHVGVAFQPMSSRRDRKR